jgi:hypothetical protein
LVESIGGGGGLDVSLEGFVSIQDSDSVAGESLNVNFSPKALAGGGGSLVLDPKTQRLTGLAVSAGVSPTVIPNGASLTYTTAHKTSIPQAVENARQGMTAVGRKAMTYLNPRPCGW